LKVYITDPELTAPGGLNVYLWIFGVTTVDIKRKNHAGSEALPTSIKEKESPRA